MGSVEGRGAVGVVGASLVCLAAAAASGGGGPAAGGPGVASAGHAAFGAGGRTMAAGVGGACCLPDLGCADVESEAECGALGGVFLAGASCTEAPCGLGACCDPDTQNCVDAPVYPCVFNGRDHQGAGTSCAQNPCDLTDGACCLGETCDVIAEADCAAMAGVFFGFGAVCFDDPCAAGACCLPGGCVNAQKFECQAMEGAFVDAGDCDGPEDPCFVPNGCSLESLFGQNGDPPDGSFFEGGTSEASSVFTRFENFSGVSGPIETVKWFGFDLQPVGGNNFVECVEADTTFTIAFYEDAGGVPSGEPVYQFTGVAERTPTGLQYLFAELNEYSVTLPVPAVITEGWVSIVGAGDPDCWFLWLSAGLQGDGSFCIGCQQQFIDYDLSLCLGGTPGGVSGACCDRAAGACADGVDIADCAAQGGVFTPNAACADLDPPCGVILGGCCLGDDGCDVAQEADCLGLGGAWAGPGSSCFACPCVTPCPPEGIDEGEVVCFDGYVDQFNGGCGSSPPVFQRLQLGDTVCGASGIYDTDLPEPTPDADWYEILLEQPANLVWTVEAEFEPLVFIIDGNNGCPAQALAGANVLQCQTLVLAANVPPGRYWLYVSPTAFTDLSACGGRYTATVSAASACPGDFDGSDAIDSADLNILLSDFGCDAGKGRCAGDADGDGDTDSIDLNILLINFGAVCKNPS